MRFQLDISKYLSLKKIPLLYSDHHLSHTLSTLYYFNHYPCVSVVVDGYGDKYCTSIHHVKSKNEIVNLWNSEYPNSLGCASILPPALRDREIASFMSPNNVSNPAILMNSNSEIWVKLNYHFLLLFTITIFTFTLSTTTGTPVATMTFMFTIFTSHLFLFHLSKCHSKSSSFTNLAFLFCRRF